MKRKLFIGLSLAVSVLVMLASWLMNMGWLRLFGTWLLLPLHHSALFIAANLVSARNWDDDGEASTLMVYSHITFLLSYILLPDGGDIGPMYFCFGLVRNDTAAHIAFIAAVIVFIVHIVIIADQFSHGRRPRE